MGVSPDTVFAQIKQIKYSKGKKEAAKRPKAEKVETDKEGMLLNLMASHRSVYQKMKDLITSEFFEKPACKKFFEELVRMREEDLNADVATVLASLDDETAKSLAGIFAAEMPYENPLKAADDIYIAIKNQKTNVNEIKSPEELSRIIELIKQQKNQSGG